ncbi:hypothetical protein [Rhodomicrobium lacus]|nr:hypothetical protein [Rhodomicrobium lacus]
MGGILVVPADALARGLLSALRLPIGVTLIGVPVFIVTLFLSSRRRRG